MNDKYLPIGVINKYIKNSFDNDPNLQKVYLKGEISNFKNHTTGHLYFSLKDETSKINAVMFRGNASSLNFSPKDGTKVLVEGRISCFEQQGSYQIYIDKMDEDGVGNLYIAFQKLKEKLEKEGLFAHEHKKILPKMPERIGIVTAPTGAAVRDIISTIRRRFPLCETILFPALVQGNNAALDIVSKIEAADKYDLDLLIVGRGGGSIEDLWPFNEEIVARAIYAAKTPIISGVGHEIDFTITDFVADLRAPTPTGAAEMAVPNILDIINDLSKLKKRTNDALIGKVNYHKLYLDSIKNSFVIKNPMMMFDNKKQKIDNLLEKINYNIINLIKNDKNRLELLMTKLELINPISVLKRGYTITYFKDKVLKDIKDINVGELVKIRLQNGILDTKVIRKEENNE